MIRNIKRWLIKKLGGVIWYDVFSEFPSEIQTQIVAWKSKKYSDLCEGIDADVLKACQTPIKPIIIDDFYGVKPLNIKAYRADTIIPLNDQVIL